MSRGSLLEVPGVTSTAILPARSDSDSSHERSCTSSNSAPSWRSAGSWPGNRETHDRKLTRPSWQRATPACRVRYSILWMTAGRYLAPLDIKGLWYLSVSEATQAGPDRSSCQVFPGDSLLVQK